MSKRSSYSAVQSSRNAKMIKGPSSGFCIAHREMVTEINSSVVWPVGGQNVYSINPGLSPMFNWLSPFAQRFEEYRFKSLRFEFRSQSHNLLNNPDAHLGTVMMAFDYNAANSGFNSKPQMENCESNVSGTSGQDISLTINRHHLSLANRFVRNGPIASNSDPRFYDLGLFQIATFGCPAVVEIGSLWVVYDVEFFKPIVNLLVDPALPQQWFHYYNSKYSSAAPLGGITYASTAVKYGNMVMYDLAPIEVGSGVGDISLSWQSNAPLCQITISWFGTADVIAYPIPDPLSGSTMFQSARAATAQVMEGCDVGLSTSLFTMVFYMTAPTLANHWHVRFLGSALPSNGTAVDVYILTLPYGFK